MYFDSFSDFLAMGGHGSYVWLAYGLMAGSLALLVLTSLRGQRRWLQEQRRQLARRQTHHSSRK